MIVSMAIAVLPVERSPMINSRWPRPSANSASITRMPVCTGSVTRARSTIGGAGRSTGSSAAAAIGGPSSSGRPSGSTTRPSRPGPTGTRTTSPVPRTASPASTLPAIIEQHAADGIFVQRMGEAELAGVEPQEFAKPGLGQAGHQRDAVADGARRGRAARCAAAASAASTRRAWRRRASVQAAAAVPFVCSSSAAMRCSSACQLRAARDGGHAARCRRSARGRLTKLTAPARRQQRLGRHAAPVLERRGAGDGDSLARIEELPAHGLGQGRKIGGEGREERIGRERRPAAAPADGGRWRPPARRRRVPGRAWAAARSRAIAASRLVPQPGGGFARLVQQRLARRRRRAHALRRGYARLRRRGRRGLRRAPRPAGRGLRARVGRRRRAASPLRRGAGR